MSTLKKYESLRGKRKLPLETTMKLHIPMDSLLKTDAMSGSLLADNSLDRDYMDDFLPNHAVIHSTILVTYFSCSILSILTHSN